VLIFSALLVPPPLVLVLPPVPRTRRSSLPLADPQAVKLQWPQVLLNSQASPTPGSQAAAACAQAAVVTGSSSTD